MLEFRLKKKCNTEGEVQGKMGILWGSAGNFGFCFLGSCNTLQFSVAILEFNIEGDQFNVEFHWPQDPCWAVCGVGTNCSSI